MAWGQEKGADVKISALRACQYEIFRLRTVFLAFENIDFADFPMFSY